ncbi:multidrug transporter MatE [Vibrio sp. qd031]|nr:multidrug transporter MatE [Vibrio sp. qd031]
MQSMLMIDTLLISPLGEISLAAMGIASTIVFFVLGIQMALANGTQLVLSRAFGSGSENSLRKGLWSGMSINFIVALLFFVLIKLFDRQLIGLLTDDASLTTEVLCYLEVSLYIVLFNAITQVMIALFNAVGRTKIPFKGYLLELPINVAASYLLVFGSGDWSGLGVQGAAAGSLIAITLRMLFLGICVRRYHAPLLSWAKLDASLRNNMRNHFREIFPVAVNITMLQTGATIYMLILSQLPLSAYVAITLVMPWVRAGTQFITAWAHSSAITVSQAIGSGQMGDLRKNVDVSIDIAVVISLFSALLFVGLSLVLPHLYPNLDDATYYALMAIAPLYIFLPIVRGYNTVHGHVLRALGKTTSVFKINFTGQWVISLPLCALIVIGLDGSIFWAFAVFAIEEMVKMLPFRYLARKSLDEFDMSKAEKLMYD